MRSQSFEFVFCRDKRQIRNFCYILSKFLGETFLGINTRTNGCSALRKL